MKKILFCLSMLLIILPLAACNSEPKNITVKNGTYTLESSSETVPLPFLTITDDNISFLYDPLSSYLPYGTYTIKDSILTMTTDDKKYKYVFRVDEDQLIFQQADSSTVKLIDRRLGTEITDNAVFRLKDN